MFKYMKLCDAIETDLIAWIPNVFISVSGVRGKEAKLLIQSFGYFIGGRTSFGALYASITTHWAGRVEVEELLLKFKKLERAGMERNHQH